MENKTYVKH